MRGSAENQGYKVNLSQDIGCRSSDEKSGGLAIFRADCFVVNPQWGTAGGIGS